jgi:hypothetical protein
MINLYIVRTGFITKPTRTLRIFPEKDMLLYASENYIS